MSLPRYNSPTMHSYRKGPASSFSKELLLKLSLALNAIFLVTWVQWLFIDKTQWIRGDQMTWHGGHPIAKQHIGSCWCGAEDRYCMCTPNMAIDLVMASHDNQHIWLVRRKDTSQLATMGGFVDVDETVEEAVHRELKEEMGIVLDPQSEQPRLQGIYSDSKRDNRRRNVSAVFVVRLAHDIQPKAADDVKDVQKIHVDEIEQHEYFADHKTILLDYRQSLHGGGLAGPDSIKSNVGDAASNQAALQIQRSVCTGRND